MTSIDRDRDVYGRLLRNLQVNGADVLWRDFSCPILKLPRWISQNCAEVVAMRPRDCSIAEVNLH